MEHKVRAKAEKQMQVPRVQDGMRLGEDEVILIVLGALGVIPEDIRKDLDRTG